jgi:hypothetical protein
MVDEKEIVWILTIEHKHGTDVYAHKTEAGAKGALLDYVQEWWSIEVGDEPIPENPDAAIERYFEEACNEFYSIQDSILYS